MRKTDILIIGAGCAGTSLAHHLEVSGYGGEVVLLDGRTDFYREQRWCSWANLPDSMNSLVRKSWSQWTVCDERTSVTRGSGSRSYKEIYAPDFFSHFHSPWRKAESKTRLKMGERVKAIREKDDIVEVITENLVWQAGLVFDARYEGSKNLQSLKDISEVYLHQTFLGWEIEFDEGVFDDQKATLMDFRTEQIEGVNFIYVLPYTNREALVESTSFSSEPINSIKHSEALEQYILENYGSGYQIRAKESGQLPMTTAKFPTRTGERIFSIGIAGGNARPSSGYAFHRIQRHTSAIAKAITQGEIIPQNFANSKYNFFDEVFLNLIAKRPNLAKDAFMRLFAKVSPDVLTRFLTEESSAFDDLSIISALPKTHFGIEGIKSILREFTRRNEAAKLDTHLHNPLADPSQRLSPRQLGG